MLLPFFGVCGLPELMAEYEVKLFMCGSPGQNPGFLSETVKVSGDRGSTVVQGRGKALITELSPLTSYFFVLMEFP